MRATGAYGPSSGEIVKLDSELINGSRFRQAPAPPTPVGRDADSSMFCGYGFPAKTFADTQDRYGWECLS